MKLRVIGSLLFLCASGGAFGQAVPIAELADRMRLNSIYLQELGFGHNLRKQANSTGRDVEEIAHSTECDAVCSTCSKSLIDDEDLRIRPAAHQSDLVVVGRVTSNISGLTKNETFVFTDSQFVIEDVLWDKSVSAPNLSSQVGKEITVVAPGGITKADGHIIRASYEKQHQLVIANRYLLFLHYIPETRSYEKYGFDGFDVTQTVVVPIKKTESPLHAHLLGDNSLFIQSIRKAILRPESKN